MNEDMLDCPKTVPARPVGFIAGAWDLLHPGHLLLFKECKHHCSKLIVGLHVDPSVERKEKNKPIETLYERWIRLKFCPYVDEIIPYETEEELLEILQTQSHPAIHKGEGFVRFLGYDYLLNENYTGHDLSYIEVKFVERSHNYSSSSYRQRFKRLKN